MAAPLRTPTKIIDWPRRSRAISSPSSATRLAIVSRDSNTLRSGIEHHLIHEFGRNRNCLNPIQYPRRTVRSLRASARVTRMLIRTSPGGCFLNLKGIQLTWLGHATFRLQTPEGKTLYVDPWIAGNPKCPGSGKNGNKAA